MLLIWTSTIESMPPALFEILASALDKVGCFVGETSGKSYAANAVWQERKNKLDEAIKNELKNFALQRGCSRLTELLEL